MIWFGTSRVNPVSESRERKHVMRVKSVEQFWIAMMVNDEPAATTFEEETLIIGVVIVDSFANSNSALSEEISLLENFDDEDEDESVFVPE